MIILDLLGIEVFKFGLLLVHIKSVALNSFVSLKYDIRCFMKMIKSGQLFQYTPIHDSACFDIRK